MTSIRMQSISERSVWNAAQLEADPSWRHTLTTEECEELRRATTTVQAKGYCVGEFDRDDFPLPRLAQRIDASVDEVETGRGVALLRGIPIEQYDYDAIRLMYWGFGVHAAIPISQNSKGQLLAEVTDKGNNYGDINARGFATNAELMPHVDTSDMTTLLCLRSAKSGGGSRVISSTAVYNVILAEHPEFLDVLARGFHNDLRGEGPTGDINELTRNRVPVYSDFGGRVSCSFNYRMIENAVRKSGISLDAHERAALDCLRQVSLREDLTYRFMLAPGDIQMVSNHSVFHARDDYIDHEQPDRKRCLLRFWMTVRNGRELAPEFAERYNTGPRGGVAVGDGARYVF